MAELSPTCHRLALPGVWGFCKAQGEGQPQPECPHKIGVGGVIRVHSAHLPVLQSRTG
jgi:hypothetical protein